MVSLKDQEEKELAKDVIARKKLTESELCGSLLRYLKPSLGKHQFLFYRFTATIFHPFISEDKEPCRAVNHY